MQLSLVERAADSDRSRLERIRRLSEKAASGRLLRAQRHAAALAVYYDVRAKRDSVPQAAQSSSRLDVIPEVLMPSPLAVEGQLASIGQVILPLEQGHSSTPVSKC